VRVGRVAMPAFMISDYRNVGYANTFLRPPQELYGQMPLNSVDGIDLTWSRQFADTTVTAQAAYGRSTIDMSSGAKAKGKNVYALNLTAEYGPFVVRAGRSGTKFTVDSTDMDALVGAFNTSSDMFGIPQLREMGMLMSSRDQKYTFTSVGASMDWNNIIVQSEYAKREMPNSFLGSSKAWYMMGGYRIGKFTPYYSHAKVISTGVANTIPRSCGAGASPFCTPTVAALSGLMEGLRLAINGSSQSTDSIGLRWNFTTSADIKFQIDRIKPQTTGLFVNTQPGFEGPVIVGAVALDFVF